MNGIEALAIIGGIVGVVVLIIMSIKIKNKTTITKNIDEEDSIQRIKIYLTCEEANKLSNDLKIDKLPKQVNFIQTDKIIVFNINKEKFNE